MQGEEFAGEARFAQALLELSEQERPRICFTTAHGETVESFSRLRRALERDGARVSEIGEVGGDGERCQVVGDALPSDAQARLTYAEVRELILAALDHLHAKGVSAMPGEEVRPPDHDVVVDDAVAIAAALTTVDAAGLDVADEDAAIVVHHLLEHLRDIGALGPPA